MTPSRLFVLAVVLVVSGCMAKINTSVNQTYVPQEGLVVEGVALLPVTAGAGLEGFRRAVGDTVSAHITTAFPGTGLVPPQESLGLLNDAGLADAYARLVTTYQTTGILDKEALASMSRALGVRYLMHCELSYAQDQSWEPGLVSNVMTTEQVSMMLRIWDSEKADVVWEAHAQGSQKSGDIVKARPFEEVYSAMARDLIRALPLRY